MAALSNRIHGELGRMTGRIIKGIAGFYYIYVDEIGIVECRAKGIFRNRRIKPLVGDYVVLDILDEEKKLGNIVDVLERKSELLRPAIANADQAMIVFAVRDPDPTFNLLDRFLVLMLRQNIETIICFNKIDKISKHDLKLFQDTYKACGCKTVFISADKEEGISPMSALLKGKTTVLAGPSGVGKSTIMNLIQPKACMEIGSIGEKIKRGKHTTRHSELICVSKGTYLFDTPGFSSLSIEHMEKEELKNYFMEFHEYEEQCKYRGCAHLNEPDCAVKRALEYGKISSIRYENYKLIFEELKLEKNFK